MFSTCQILEGDSFLNRKNRHADIHVMFMHAITSMPTVSYNELGRFVKIGLNLASWCPKKSGVMKWPSTLPPVNLAWIGAKSRYD